MFQLRSPDKCNSGLVRFKPSWDDMGIFIVFIIILCLFSFFYYFRGVGSTGFVPLTHIIL